MNVSLTTELAEFVKQQVSGGMYQTASEVIRDGLRILKQREQFRQIQIEELRKQVAIGIEQLERGEYVVMDENTFADIKAEGRRRLAELQEGQKS